MKWIAAYHGVKEVNQNGINGRFMILDDLTAGYEKPSVIDLKIGTKTWEEFISKFTENKHIINSKYIRQVILGNCNPKRHITYEKYLMNEVLDILIKEIGY